MVGIMQKARPLKIVQFVVEPFQQPVSGADLRNDAVMRALLPVADVKVVSPQTFSTNERRLAYSKSTPTVLAPDDACVQNFVNYIGREKPQIVVVEGVALLKFCEHLCSASKTDRPILILDCHNAESALFEEVLAMEAPKLARRIKSLGNGRKLHSARNADARALNLFARVLVPTQNDQLRLEKLAETPAARDKIRIVANIAPKWTLEHLSLSGGVVQEGRRPVRRLLFVGLLRYPPNVDAVRGLLRQVWPCLTSEFSGMHLSIAGRQPKSRIRRWVKSADNVDLIADPASMKDIYASVDAVVVPLKAGGGSRLKVLEAMAVGKPVIASAKAVEGLEMVDGRHWLRAETPADYVAAIRRLDNEPDLASELAENGRGLVSIRYNEQSLESALKTLIAEVTPMRSEVVPTQ